MGRLWDGIEELRYVVLAACVTGKDPESPKQVLDLGRGVGILRSYLPGTAINRYTGVDWSVDAVEKGRLAGYDRSVFHAASVDEWEPDGHYDAIVFNEVLYYLPEPATAVERYTPFLRSGGSIFVSMWYPSTFVSRWRPSEISMWRARLGCWRIWRSLDGRFDIHNDIVVERTSIRRWRMQQLSPR